MRNKIILSLKIVLVISVIFALLNYKIIDFNSIRFLLDFNIIPIILLLVLTIPISTFIWWNLLKDQNYNINYKSSFLIYTTGVFFNVFMPGGVGGDVVKGYYLYKYTEESKRTSSVMTVIISRIIGLHSMITLCIIASLLFIEKIFLDKNLTSIFLTLYLIYGFILLMLFVLFYIKKVPNIIINRIKKENMSIIRDIIFKVINAISFYRHKKKLLLKCWLISLINHLIFIYAFYLVAKILKLDFLSFFET